MVKAFASFVVDKELTALARARWAKSAPVEVEEAEIRLDNNACKTVKFTASGVLEYNWFQPSLAAS